MKIDENSQEHHNHGATNEHNAKQNAHEQTRDVHAEADHHGLFSHFAHTGHSGPGETEEKHDGLMQLRLLYKTLITIHTMKPIFPRSFQTCPQLAQELCSTAIKHVCAELIKSVTCMKLKKFVDARNRIDLPYGMFGMSWDNFFLRRQQDTLYMDVLRMVNKDTLQLAKDCVVLDEVQEFVRRLFEGYKANDLKAVLLDLRNAQKLLGYEEVIREHFKINNEELQHLRFKLTTFSKYEREMTDKLNNQVYDAINECADAELVKSPIEFRYQLQYQKGGLDQFKLKLVKLEDKYNDKLRKLNQNLNRENLGSNYSRSKYKADIEMLKSKLAVLSKRFEEDSERLDGDLTYTTNASDALHNQWADCRKQMAQHSIDIVALKEWNDAKVAEEREKMHQQLLKEERARKRKEARAKRLAKKAAKKMKKK